MADLTFAAVAQHVRRLAQENPDHRYEQRTSSGCWYTRIAGEPGAWPTLEGDCIWGQAFIAAGVDPAYLRDGCEDKTVNEVFELLGIMTTFQQREWARRVQNEQDFGVPWGQCVATADGLHPLEPTP